MRKMLSMVGWVGAALLLAAFAANSYGYLSTHQPLYQILNLVGAAGIAVQARDRHAYPAMTLNVIWMIVAIIALFRIYA